MKIKKMKEKALKKLKGNYTIIIIAILIYSLIEGVFSGTSKLIYNENMNIFFNIIIMGLLYMGLVEIVVKIAKGKKPEIKDLFSRTDLFWKSSAVTIIITAFTVLCTILETIAFKSLTVFTSYQADINPTLSATMILIGVILCTAILAFYIVLMISFSQVYYVLYENKDMPLFQIFERSMDLMEDHKVDFVIFNFSFLGWAFVGIFTFGLLYFWLVPYYYVASYNFYEEVKELEENPEKRYETKKSSKTSKKVVKKAEK